MSAKQAAADAPITIKKYANRRLYNTATSSYVTLDHLSKMVKEGEDFVVYDAKSGDDITRSVLTQIIVEEESKGEHLLPTSFLRQLIGFYGGNMEMLVPKYLEHTMQSFAKNQEQMNDMLRNSMGGMFPLQQMEELSKQNRTMFEQAMKMFTPGAAMGETGTTSDSGKSASNSNLDDLNRKITELQEQLAEISKKA
ncbi:MAG TPA: polyhydroxyalkanoate synthesis repressor PhaR [Rhodospirillaceae bacterium]|nr:polyhydroxyalkanoate synthesis repressor PhaR [Alphaproteobacteria bacterium]OUT39251.1 MAG: polyhydroxyalkanoate synthesis repressor PhaR [Micavibrio sp. TMED2]HCI47972.1 polyhydroxyalkanoate synthesis repressor PhaR [Rhodospirillaceae bacterium]MAS48603.1 polyhydroxyalkanoate synthesis repressor PhaR [Alphaproteobacteria bacterium]MAX96138.1 polyhydroxyalkanoate synthesis repressor PhaR [Alphaproteobacteria bacterium]|tara:strand:+ start:1183 stop:1770 length:588 start_codon:yes stop_codon:yes gene_type:complete